jgi:hypothetical protein
MAEHRLADLRRQIVVRYRKDFVGHANGALIFIDRRSLDPVSEGTENEAGMAQSDGLPEGKQDVRRD